MAHQAEARVGAIERHGRPDIGGAATIACPTGGGLCDGRGMMQPLPFPAAAGRLAALILAAIGLAPAAAQVEEIVVTGRGLAAPAAEAVSDIAVISRARLQSVASGRLEDVLRDVAGFQQFRRSDSRSAHPTSQGATLRGLGGNASSRVLVLLDGVPQVDPFGGWVNWQAFDPVRLGQVRVVRGGGSGVAGPGALAGTIEIESGGAADLPRLWGAAAYGSRDAVDADAGVSARIGGGFASISAGYQRGDGFVPIVRDRRGAVDGPAGYRQGSVALRAVFPIGADTEVQAGGIVTRDERSRGVPFTGNSNTGADASLRLVGRGRWGWEALAYLQSRDFRSAFGSVNTARTVATKTLEQYSVPATGIGGRLELRPPIGAGVELRLGADGRVTTGRTQELFTYVAGTPTRRRRAGGRTETGGAFAELTWLPSRRITLTASGRIDRWRIVDGSLAENVIGTAASLSAIAFPDRRGWEPTGRVGAALMPGGGVTLRAAAYRGWRLPTLNELYRPFRAGVDATGPNPALAPETATGVDGGVEWRPLPTIHVGATVFHTVLDDAIANITLGRGPGTFPIVGFVAANGAYRQRGNLGGIRSNGAELSGGWDDGRLSLTASWSLADARVRASGAAASLDGLRPAQTPRTQAALVAGWRDAAGARVEAAVRRTAGQYEDDQNSRRLPPATTVDATAAWPLAAGLLVEVRAENVFDKQVAATIAADGTIERATPRTLWLGVRVQRF